MLQLGIMLSDGNGCEQDPATATEYAERLIGLHGDLLAKEAGDLLVTIAYVHFELGDPTSAMSILTPLAESGNTFAKYKLSFACHENGDHATALKLLEEAFFDEYFTNDDKSLAVWSAHQAVKWSIDQHDDSRAKFWLGVTNKHLRVILSSHDSPFDIPASIQFISAVRGGLRTIRNECKGCGAPLHGTMRKKCGGCKTYCYCNRDCQKAHWNRPIGGHREDCKGVMELKEKMKEGCRNKVISEEK